MALYVSTKHAVEGYSQSLDHEVREHGVRVLLVEPGPINTPFAGHSVQADTPMPLYAAGRRTFDEVLAKNLSGGDDPAVVAKVIVAAATDRNPKLRRTAGWTARTINAVYRVAPGPQLRPHHPQIQPDACWIQAWRLNSADSSTGLTRIPASTPSCSREPIPIDS